MTVAGTPDYYPLIDGREVTYFVTSQEGEVGDEEPTDQGVYFDYLRYEDQGGGIFHRVQTDDDFAQIHGWDIVSRPAAGLLMHGFYELDDGEPTMFSTPVTFLQFPPSAGASWNTQAGVVGAPQFEVAATGQWVELLDRMPVGTAKNGMQVYWTEVWVATLSYTMSEGGTVLYSGTDTMYLAPGFGMARGLNDEVDHADQQWELREKWLILPSMR